MTVGSFTRLGRPLSNSARVLQWMWRLLVALYAPILPRPTLQRIRGWSKAVRIHGNVRWPWTRGQTAHYEFESTRIPELFLWPEAADKPSTVRWSRVRSWGGWSRIVRWSWLAVVLYVIVAYFVVNEVLPGRVSADTNLYIVQPLIWGQLASLCVLLLKLNKVTFDVPLPRMLFFAAWAAGFHVAGLIGAGLLYGFGHSPYANDQLHMLENGLYLSTLVLGVEFARAYLLQRFYPRSPFLAMVGVSIGFAALMVPISNFYVLDSVEPGLRVSGETLLPALALSTLASYLAMRGGPLPAFLYHSSVLAFEWFSPILPNLDWTVTAFVETIVPLIALITVRGGINEAPLAEGEVRKLDVSIPWVAATAVAVGLLWFSTGLLGVTPSVVTGVSMEPTMHEGDLTVTHEVDPGELVVGDIVEFIQGDTRVIHRIIEIEETVDGRVFVTQGDNNNTSDEPILAGQIQGEVMFTVPKAGWVAIGFTELVNKLR